MGETPVTQAQFALWTKAEQIEHENHFKGHPDNPAENMDLRQANGFCDWLTRVKGEEFPDGYRLACLPTEAEWEYACRAGTETEYYTGDGEAALDQAGWYGEEWKTGSTHPVRQKAFNTNHLYDMHGNVLEWCHDEWDASTYRKRVDGVQDPGWDRRLDNWRSGIGQITQSDQVRVVRGGSWDCTAFGCRSACRIGHGPNDRYRIDGFRVCLVLGPAEGSGAQTGRGREAEREPGDGGRGTRPESEGESEAELPDLSKARFRRKK